MSRFLFCESSANLGGQELQILLQMAALQRAGHEAVLACPKGSAIAGEARARGLNLTPIAFRNSCDVPSMLALRRLLRASNIDYALCHSGHDAANLFAAASLLRSRPTMVRVRTYQPGFPKALTHNWMVDRTLVPSEYLRQRILANPGIRPGRVAVLRPILPLADLRAQSRDPLPEALAVALGAAKPVIVQAAMLRPEKGHRVALRAISGLRRRYPGLRYVIAGSGPEEGGLRREAAELGLGQSVVFAGLVVPIYPLLARADIVIMPSLDEPLGLSQLEALALGIPVAVSDAGGLPETVTHGRTGWVIPAGDAAAWREGLAQALSDVDRARDMASLGRSFVEACFGPEAHLAALEAELARAREPQS